MIIDTVGNNRILAIILESRNFVLDIHQSDLFFDALSYKLLSMTLTFSFTMDI